MNRTQGQGTSPILFYFVPCQRSNINGCTKVRFEGPVIAHGKLALVCKQEESSGGVNHFDKPGTLCQTLHNGKCTSFSAMHKTSATSD